MMMVVLLLLWYVGAEAAPPFSSLLYCTSPQEREREMYLGRLALGVAHPESLGSAPRVYALGAVLGPPTHPLSKYR